MKICIRFIALLLMVILWENGQLFSQTYRAVEQNILDFKYQNFPPHITPSNKIVFVDIDEESIQLIYKTKGNWPWTRDVWSDTLSLISKANPKSVLFDILLTEKTAPHEADLKLAQVIRDFPRASFAVSFKAGDRKQLNQAPRRFPASQQALTIDIENFFASENSFTNYVRPYDAAWESLNHVHFVNSFKDADGSLRSTPIFLTYDKKIYPSLALKAVQIYLDYPKMKIEKDTLVLESTKTPEEQNLQITINKNNQSPFHFYRDKFQTVSLGSIYSLTGTDSQSAIQLLTSYFKDKIVIIGSSSPMLNDLKSTPLSRAYPGALLHATLISNILENHILRPMPLLASIAVTLVIVFLIQFSFSYFKNFYLKNVTPIVIMLLFCLLNIYAFQYQNLNQSFVGPIFFGLLVYIDNIVQLVRHESRESPAKAASTIQYETLNS